MATQPSFAVTRTGPVEKFVPRLPHYSQDLAGIQRIFDAVPIEEVRKQCIAQLEYPYEERIQWFIDRIHAYLDINDYPTVLMLLRGLVPATDERNHEKIFGVVLDVFERAFDTKAGGGRDELEKEITVILCGLLLRYPKAYNKRAKKLIQTVLQLRDTNEWGLRIHLRLVNIIGVLRDTTFLPDVKKFILPMKDGYQNLESQFKYFSISEERRALDAHARQVVAFLTHLASKKIAQPVE